MTAENMNPHQDRGFYCLTKRRIQEMHGLSGLSVLVLVYVLNRWGAGSYKPLTYEHFAKDCFDKNFSVRAFRAIVAKLAKAELIQTAPMPGRTVQLSPAPGIKWMVGYPFGKGKPEKSYMRFTDSLRRWLAAILCSKRKRVKGPLVQTFCAIAHKHLNPMNTIKRWTCAHLAGMYRINREAFRASAKVLKRLGIVKRVAGSLVPVWTTAEEADTFLHANARPIAQTRRAAISAGLDPVKELKRLRREKKRPIAISMKAALEDTPEAEARTEKKLTAYKAKAAKACKKLPAQHAIFRVQRTEDERERAAACAYLAAMSWDEFNALSLDSREELYVIVPEWKFRVAAAERAALEAAKPKREAKIYSLTSVA